MLPQAARAVSTHVSWVWWKASSFFSSLVYGSPESRFLSSQSKLNDHETSAGVWCLVPDSVLRDVVFPACVLSSKDACALMRVCKKFCRSIRASNALWKRLYFTELDSFMIHTSVKYRLNVKSWYTMFQRKMQSKIKRRKDVPREEDIIGCDLAFVCPMSYDELLGDIEEVEVISSDDGSRHVMNRRMCQQCDKYVYNVTKYVDQALIENHFAPNQICISFYRESIGFENPSMGIPDWAYPLAENPLHSE